MKTIPVIDCVQCGKSFKQWDGDKKKSHWRRRFCSRKCQYSSYKKDIDGFNNCIECSKEMPFRYSLKVRSYNGVFSANSKYCSRSCLLKYIGHLPRRSTKGRPSPLKGTKRSMETRMRISLAQRGEKHPNWKGGISGKNQAERSCIELKEWRKQIFERDNYTCQHCGYRGKGLEADHIKSWAKYPDLRFVLENGRTLCKPCHAKTPNYRGKKQVD